MRCGQHARRFDETWTRSSDRAPAAAYSCARAHDAALAARRIEVRHARRRHRALPERVEAAPVELLAVVLHVVARSVWSAPPTTRRLIRLHRRPAELLDQQAGHRERLIAHHLRRQPETRSASQQPVLGIALQQSPAWPSTPAGTSRSSRSVFCSALTSQPVRTNSVASQSSSSGMRRRLALRAEVLGRLHEAGAEVHLPEPVDRHPRSQRIRRIDKPLREAQPVAWNPPAAAAGSRALRVSPSRRADRKTAHQQDTCRAASGMSSITITVGRLS